MKLEVKFEMKLEVCFKRELARILKLVSDDVGCDFGKVTVDDDNAIDSIFSFAFFKLDFVIFSVETA